MHIVLRTLDHLAGQRVDVESKEAHQVHLFHVSHALQGPCWLARVRVVEDWLTYNNPGAFGDPGLQ